MARSEEYRALMGEAAEWRVMGLLLERPHGGWHAEVSGLGREVRDAGLAAAVAASDTATESAYLRLVGPGGLVSPREVTYQPFADPGQLLAELATWYEAFAFRPQVEEPIDHLAVEVAFVGYLLLKEAFARARGEAAAAQTTASARHSFIEAHLAAFAASFAQRLEATGPSYLLAAAQQLSARVPAPARQESAWPVGGALDICGACKQQEV